MLKLRLTRLGDKKRPSYRVVAMEALSKRDGKAVAYLGNYFPLEDSRVLDTDRKAGNKKSGRNCPIAV